MCKGGICKSARVHEQRSGNNLQKVSLFFHEFQGWTQIISLVHRHICLPQSEGEREKEAEYDRLRHPQPPVHRCMHPPCYTFTVKSPGSRFQPYLKDDSKSFLLKSTSPCCFNFFKSSSLSSSQQYNFPLTLVLQD